MESDLLKTRYCSCTLGYDKKGHIRKSLTCLDGSVYKRSTLSRLTLKTALEAFRGKGSLPSQTVRIALVRSVVNSSYSLARSVLI